MIILTLAELDHLPENFIQALKQRGALIDYGRRIAINDEVYEELVIKYNPRGLGDWVARLTKAVGIRPCRGCRKRQAKLNKWFPFNAAS